VIPAKFDYAAPASLEEALSTLASAGEDAKLMAGGQSLIPVLRLRLADPSTVIDLTGVAEMHGVRDDGDAIVVGACTPHVEVLADTLLSEHLPLVGQATATVADRQVRRRGTFGGALAHADPAGDLGAVALAADAELVIASQGGARRTVAAADFFVDYLTTVVEPTEILVEIRLPKLTGWGTAYEKFQRVAQAWSIVGVAAAVKVEGGTVSDARIGLTNMGSTPLRATDAEQALIGQPASAESIASAAAKAAEGTEPPSDVNGQADYRKQLAVVLTRRALAASMGL